jgi:ubiquinone/menaquinone biosynthesis C-methylase UbiE
MTSQIADYRTRLAQAIDGAINAFSSVPTDGLGAYIRVQAALMALVVLEDVCADMDADPFPPLLAVFAAVAGLPGNFGSSLRHMRQDKAAAVAKEGHESHVTDLYEAAWTHYNDDAYDHSVELIKERLLHNEFDEKFFAGKECFDGGCGTGRFSVAVAKAGASKAVAADIGGKSLAYLDKIRTRYGLDQIEIVRQDVTDLSSFPSDSFDFVASNGVLHHTLRPEQGIIEHLRIVRPGGVFWLYLYGAGGIYWETFDRMRPLLSGIAPHAVLDILNSLQIRQGLIYAYLDNFMAPRKYYRLEQVLELLRPHAEFTWAHAKGGSPIDDSSRLVSTRWGREIYGPDGEIRIVITKTSQHRA